MLTNAGEQSQESFNEGVPVPTACLGLLLKLSFIRIPHLVPGLHKRLVQGNKRQRTEKQNRFQNINLKYKTTKPNTLVTCLKCGNKDPDAMSCSENVLTVSWNVFATFLVEGSQNVL